jgi:ABC-type branched-subunit amino acid transport system ATPase component
MKKFEILGYFRKSISLLSSQDKRKYYSVVILQSAISLLDLIGVGLVSIVVALSVTGVQSQEPSQRIFEILNFFGLESFTFQSQVAIIGSVASFFFILKTLLTMFISRKILFFLGRRSAQISNVLTERFLGSGAEVVNHKTVPEIQYSLGIGVNSIAIGILGLSATVMADVSLLVVITIGLIFVDPIIALSSFIMFAAIAILLHRLLHQRARLVGSQIREYAIKSNYALEEAILAYREIYVKGRLKFYTEKVNKDRINFSFASAEQILLPNISKYVFETSLIVCAMFVSAIQFTLNDAVAAAAGLALFLAAGSRIAPALLRIQQSLTSIQGNIGTSLGTFELVDSMKTHLHFPELKEKMSANHGGFVPSISFKNVDFCYQGTQTKIFENVNIEIVPGSFVAIVGPSGAGKSTFTDLILGVLKPQSGRIEVSGLPTNKAIEEWPGAIGYVPQEVTIFNTTILENIAMGYEVTDFVESLVCDALTFGSFSEDFLNQRFSSNELLNSRGSNLSGGQKQRIGISRAMVTKPKLLILDEATSSLDSKTESEIGSSLVSLRGHVTLVVVAHRLSTILGADKVIYIDAGGIQAMGTFEEVRRKVPDFDEQASLMGL